MNQKINIGLCGLGKAGRELVQYIEYSGNCTDFSLTDILCRDESPTAGKSVSEITGIITKNNCTVTPLSEFKNNNGIKVLIDFSASETSKKLFDLCCKEKINAVICTTAFSEEELSVMKKKTEESKIGVIFAPTLTLGINLLIDFCRKFAKFFPDFSFEIIEKHGKTKSSPTKTAQVISQHIARDDTKISSIRLNGYVGVHEVIATDGYEKISIEHESFSRCAFVRGALFAARYICGKKGFFVMNDVVNNIFEGKINDGKTE